MSYPGLSQKQTLVSTSPEFKSPSLNILTNHSASTAPGTPCSDSTNTVRLTVGLPLTVTLLLTGEEVEEEK